MDEASKQAVLIDAVRTPIGRYAGALKDVRPDDLMAHAIKQLLLRNPGVPVDQIEDVLVGCANQAGEDNRNVARMAVLLAGLPETVAGGTVNRLCGSGLMAVNQAVNAIKCGEGDIYIAGGVESMTRSPFVMGKPETAFGRGDTKIVDCDEHPRPETTMADLAKLKPAFAEAGKGSVTAGNASGINDGASAVLITSMARAKQLGLKPMAKFVSGAVAGVDPAIMGIGPVPATRKALQRANLSISDIDLIELNEAFAVQVLACVRQLEIDLNKVNVNGGSIALGHPLGASGARILTTLVHEMHRSKAKLGLATMCIGVGQGVATIIESV